MKHAPILALALCSQLACNDAETPAKVADPARESAVEVLVFPGLEAFEFLKGWDEISPAGQLEREADLARWIDEMAEDYGDPSDEAQKPRNTGGAQERACQLLPGAMQVLGTRLDDGSWTADDRAFAVRVARLASFLDPSADFRFDTEPRPTAELQRLVTWFEARTAEPKTLSLMVSSSYSGPWFTRDVETDLEISVDDVESLSNELELEIGHRDDGTWCMRGRTGGAVQWVTELGMPADQPVAFGDEPPVDLGSYGWRLSMVLGSPAEFYVSRDGRALFYFARN
ncbi:MAG: hypothetical protein H6831_10740 [Planctomycetes bacterium]|nr:hypothetical protein [Planctomycetota bacterium]MCB9904873.1 hypothetical protein [Planctomycetota bacterium]